MHKSEQKIEKTYTVEGPNDKGEYRVTYPDGFRGEWWAPPNGGGAWIPEAAKAVENHIESLPKPPVNWAAYLALGRATRKVGRPPATSPLHEYTDLTADEAITLMELLNKITTPRPQDRDTTLERRLIVSRDDEHLVIVETEPDVWFYEDEDGDSRYNHPSDVDGKPGEIVMLLELTGP